MSGCLAVILCIFFPPLIPFVIIYYLACILEEVSIEKNKKWDLWFTIQIVMLYYNINNNY